MAAWRSLAGAIVLVSAVLMGEVSCLHSLPVVATTRARRTMVMPRPLLVLRCSGGGGGAGIEEASAESYGEGEGQEEEEEDGVGGRGGVPDGGQGGLHARSRRAGEENGSVRAAFGVQCKSEVSAGVVNLAVTVLMALSMMAAKMLLGSGVVQPLLINSMIKILWGAAAVQLPVLLLLAYRTGALRRGAGLWTMRAAGFVCVFLVLLHAPGIGDSPTVRSEAPGGLGQEGATQGAPQCGPVCEAASPMDGGGGGSAPPGRKWWESALEAVFAATGNELAIKGLKVARGERLTEEEKQRVRELAAREGEAPGDTVLQAMTRGDENVEESETPVMVEGEEGQPGGGAATRVLELRKEGREGGTDAQGFEGEEAGDEGGDAAEEDAGGVGEGPPGMPKIPPSLCDMLPPKAQPLALMATLIMPLVTLVLQLRGLGDTAWVRQKDMEEEEQVLAGSHAQIGKRLAGLVATAFEENLVRRDHYIQILAASLAAIGSAQGILKLLQDKDWPTKPTLSSGLMLRISQTNAYMVWMGLASLLSRLGQYDRSAILYLSRPKASSPWGKSGMVQGRVSAHLAKEGQYTLALIVKLEDGSSFRHQACMQLDDFKGSDKGSFRQKEFVDAVTRELILEFPWE